MCGIFYSSDPGINQKRLERATFALQHRGPDYSKAITIDSKHKMGHTRLSITDPDDRSNQPFFSTSGAHCIIFNGEIYNFQKLKSEENFPWKTDSDTEVVVELFEKYGPKFLDRLNGMFAIVILNLITNEIFAARDRLGVKPLFYRKKTNSITLSSEVSVFHTVFDDLTPNPLGIEQYKTLRSTFGGTTFYEEISEFPAGSYYQEGKFQTYWELSEPNLNVVDLNLLDELICNSIEIRIPQDVSYGSFLSGGVDSAIIAKVSKVRQTWCVGMPQSNEFAEASENAKFVNSVHNNLLVDDTTYLDTARFMINARKEPLSVPNEVLLYLLAQEASKSTKVIFSGEGADELFGGYSRVFEWSARKQVFDLNEFAALYSYSANPNLEILESALRPFMHFENPYLIVSSFFQKFHLHGLLKRLDYATMLAGVESRNPFVDYRLVEYLFGIPLAAKNSEGTQSKWLLRNIASKYLPTSSAFREKVGFPVSIGKILSLKTDVNRQEEYDAWTNFNLRELNLIESENG
jgi:asparagine synthase (glutamine-hydrolysing)